MSNLSKHPPDGSWVFNQDDEGDGDISWAEDTDPSDTDARLKGQKLQTPPQKRSSARQTPTSHSVSSMSQPDFVMPAIEQRPRPLDRSQAKPSPRTKIQNSQTRQKPRAAKSTSAPPQRRYERSVGDRALDMLVAIGEYLLDFAGSTLQTLKRPVSWVLAAYLFAGLLMFAQNLFTSTINTALSPLCRIPGSSLLHLPFCQSPYGSTDQSTISPPPDDPADPEFDALMTVQGKFETILEDSAAGIALPMDMKLSESSIRDLRFVVRYSDIPSRNELLLELDGFIETARIASFNLQKFNSHVGRAVDIVLSTARWTQRVLDDISYKTLQSSHTSFLGDLIHNKLLAPFQPLQFNEAQLLNQYMTHANLISDEIETLLKEAQALLLVLANLENRLDDIQSVAARDDIATRSSRDEILGDLWTFLGRNRGKLDRVDKRLQLLARVGDYRKLAYAHVAGTILKLQSMSAELEELKTRVRGADSLSDRGIPGIPLSVHLEAIRLGVERLEVQRERSREVEKRYVNGIFDGTPGEKQAQLIAG